MKRHLTVLTSAALGVALVLAAASLAGQLGLIPRFPAHGGDDDFNLRAAVFFLVVCPAFAVLGAFIGHAYRTDFRRAGHAWIGAVGGTAGLLCIGRLLAGWVERIETRELANASAVSFILALPALAALGALAASRLSPQRRCSTSAVSSGRLRVSGIALGPCSPANFPSQRAHMASPGAN